METLGNAKPKPGLSPPASKALWLLEPRALERTLLEPMTNTKTEVGKPPGFRVYGVGFRDFRSLFA